MRETSARGPPLWRSRIEALILPKWIGATNTSETGLPQQHVPEDLPGGPLYACIPLPVQLVKRTKSQSTRPSHQSVGPNKVN